MCDQGVGSHCLENPGSITGMFYTSLFIPSANNLESSRIDISDYHAGAIPIYSKFQYAGGSSVTWQGFPNALVTPYGIFAVSTYTPGVIDGATPSNDDYFGPDQGSPYGLSFRRRVW